MKLHVHLKLKETKKLKEWHGGPKFIRMDEHHWPSQPSKLPGLGNDDQELTKVTSHSCTTLKEDSLSYLLHR